MTATCAPAPPVTRLVPVQPPSREERREDLRNLADAVTLGPEPSRALVRLQVLAWASERWSPQAAMRLWGWLVDETDRRHAVEADPGYWLGASAEQCRADEAAVLDDLILGTDRYQGRRAS